MIEDPRAENITLATTWFTPCLIVAVYLIVIKKLGLQFMKNRQPFNIDKILIIYNAFQTIACAAMTIQGIILITQINDFLYEPVTHSYQYPFINQFYMAYAYYLLKIVDLLDTVFFVMRKNTRQITFLHVYHHAAMVLLTYLSLKYFGGGLSLYYMTVNSLVHVVMYLYYLLTVYDPAYKASVWWKKHITQMQLVQFVFLFCLMMPSLINPDCNYPKLGSFLTVSQSIIFFTLFSNFYYRNYIKKVR